MNSPPSKLSKERREFTTNELPVVFQCENCRTIVGDTVASIAANDSLRMIILKSVTKKVRVRDKLMSSPHSVDLGSSYNPLCCETCNTDLGRIYRTTTLHLDDLRDKYSLYVDRLTCYKVGSEEQTMESPSVNTFPSLRRVEQQILKLQAVSVQLNSRLMNVEDRLKDDSS